ncbi:3-phosphoshikimate 1-carboxyvinyltransferase [Phascolarctobacterium sp.]
MTTLKITPAKLGGSVCAPSSKSMGHREIICAGLSDGTSIVDNISMSADMEATLRCLEALGISFQQVPSSRAGRTAFAISGSGKVRAACSAVDCGESGSTLRFMIPLGALCGAPLTFTGHGKLVTRPLQAYYDIFDRQGLHYTTAAKGYLPLTVNGVLQSGAYELPGNVSSQFISGLLFALPLLEGDSVLEITSGLESQSYVDLTLSCLAKYGIIIEHENYYKYHIRGGQRYRGGRSMVEGDWSQAAFWLVAGTLGRQITCTGLHTASLQGDRVVAGIISRMGGKITSDAEGNYTALPAPTKGVVIDAADCPDIIPVLTVLAAVSEGTTEIINAGRLRIKECDRLAAMTSELNKLGAAVTELPDGLLIKGRPEGLRGGCVDAWNDHRIAMSLAVASLVCREAVIVSGSECVQKSYPEFWKDFTALGGNIETVGMGEGI